MCMCACARGLRSLTPHSNQEQKKSSLSFSPDPHSSTPPPCKKTPRDTCSEACTRGSAGGKEAAGGVGSGGGEFQGVLPGEGHSWEDFREMNPVQAQGWQGKSHSQQKLWHCKRTQTWTGSSEKHKGFWYRQTLDYRKGAKTDVVGEKLEDRLHGIFLCTGYNGDHWKFLNRETIKK